MSSNDTYKTSDLGIATYLLSYKEELTDTKREGNDKRMTFIFTHSPTIEERATEFINGGMVEAKLFLHTLRDLRAMTYKKE